MVLGLFVRVTDVFLWRCVDLLWRGMLLLRGRMVLLRRGMVLLMNLTDLRGCRRFVGWRFEWCDERAIARRFIKGSEWILLVMVRRVLGMMVVVNGCHLVMLLSRQSLLQQELLLLSQHLLILLSCELLLEHVCLHHWLCREGARGNRRRWAGLLCWW